MSKYNQARVDQLLQFILAVAGKESGWERELGMIHLIKYVYLVDLTYAKYHNGETYTGLTWVFHNFGPWSIECHNSIEPALEAIGATKKTIPSDKYKDFNRWCSDDYKLYEMLYKQMDITVAGAVLKYVKKYGNDTYGLLDFVYKTEPMLNAAPEETLDFFQASNTDDLIEDAEKVEPTISQKKKRKQKINEFKEKLNKKLEEKVNARKLNICPLPPRYDDVFFNGLEQLDETAGILPEEGKYLASFSDNIWKSKARHDPELA